MEIDTNILVPMTDANQNFSKVARIVDEKGMAVIMKNNKPKYVLVEFGEYNRMYAGEINHAKELRKSKINETANKLITENIEAFKELAK